MEIYLPKAVEQSREFYGELLSPQTSNPYIADHLEALANRMWQGLQAGNEVVFREISNYHKAHLGRSTEVLRKLQLTEADCRQAIANEFGFNRWIEVVPLRIPYDAGYEQAIDSMLLGDLEKLQELITLRPELLNQKSRYGHGAALLHYAVSNGVEIWRQMVPMNLPEVVAFLIEEGASLKSKMQVYGGEYTAPELLLSSMHPRNAGIFEELRTLMEI